MHTSGRIVTDRNATHEKHIRVGLTLHSTSDRILIIESIMVLTCLMARHLLPIPAAFLASCPLNCTPCTPCL